MTMTSNATSALFDANAWLALCHRAHPHHRAMLAVWPNLPRGVFCRVTQMTLLRLLTRKLVMGSDLQSPAQAWKTWRMLQEDHGAVMLDEPAGVEALWRDFSKAETELSGAAWTDAYLAAFAIGAGMEFVTFDQGFKRFQNLRVQILS